MTEQLRKNRKHVLLATFLTESFKRSGRLQLRDVEAVPATACYDNPGQYECDWQIEDAVAIARISRLWFPDPQKFVEANLTGLTENLEEESYRRCSMCRKEKPVSEFHRNQLYCKKCRSRDDYFRYKRRG